MTYSQPNDDNERRESESPRILYSKFFANPALAKPSEDWAVCSVCTMQTISTCRSNALLDADKSNVRQASKCITRMNSSGDVFQWRCALIECKLPSQQATLSVPISASQETWTLLGQSQPLLQVLPHHKFLLDNRSASYALHCRPFIELMDGISTSCLAFIFPYFFW